MIRGRRVQLRALEKSDLPFLHKLHNNNITMAYFFEEPYETLLELEDLFDKHIHNQTERRFVIEEMHTRACVGVLSLIEINEINRRCEIDIIIDDQYQGRGYGKEGFILGIKYGFDILNLYKIYLLLLPDNEPGLRIYKYAGLKRESRLKKEYFVNGKYVDVLRMCIFEHQWRKLRPRFEKEVGIEEGGTTRPPKRPAPRVAEIGEVLREETPQVLVAAG